MHSYPHKIIKIMLYLKVGLIFFVPFAILTVMIAIDTFYHL